MNYVLYAGSFFDDNLGIYFFFVIDENGYVYHRRLTKQETVDYYKKESYELECINLSKIGDKMVVYPMTETMFRSEMSVETGILCEYLETAFNEEPIGTYEMDHERTKENLTFKIVLSEQTDNCANFALYDLFSNYNGTYKHPFYEVFDDFMDPLIGNNYWVLSDEDKANLGHLYDGDIVVHDPIWDDEDEDKMVDAENSYFYPQYMIKAYGEEVIQDLQINFYSNI